MNLLTRFSLKNALVIIMIIIMIAIGGIYSTSTIQEELMPNISIPYIFVTTIYPGAAPEDVADSISRPIEKAISGIEGIKQVNTLSNENYSNVMISFSYSKNMEKAEREVQDAVNKIELPVNAQKSTVTRFSYGSIPVVGYSVTCDKGESELTKIIKDKIQPSLSGIKGVGSVSVDGVSDKSIIIKLDSSKLKAYGITFDTVQNILMANNLNIPAGNVDISGKTLSLKTERKIYNINDIKSIPVGAMPVSSNPAQGSISSRGSSQIRPLFLSDIAAIAFEKPTGDSFTRSNQKPTVFLTIYKNEDANAVLIEKDVREKIEQLNKDYPYIKLKKIDDSARYVTTSVNSMVREGLLGALFAIIIIALFLRNIRATIIAAISIPLSILIALILMPRLGLSLNIMSLSGMAVATGRIVDDSIVVIENIFRRLQKSKSEDPNVIQDATGEVSSAITSSTLTTVAVFLPLTLIDGMVGKIFASFAFTVVISILASLLVAITVVPLMSRFMLVRIPTKHKDKTSRIEGGYKKVLAFALRHRLLVVLTSIVLLIASFFLVSQVGVQFLPPDKNNIITANLKLPVGASVEKTNVVASAFEKYLSENSAVDLVTSRVGDTSSSSDAKYGEVQGTNEASFTIVLKDKKDTDRMLSEIKNKTKSFGKENIWTIKPLDHFSGGETLEIIVNGNNIDDITAASKAITKQISKIPELFNITNNLSEKKPEVSFKVDSLKAIAKGTNPYSTGMQLRNMLNSQKIGSAMIEGKPVDVMLGFGKNDLSSLEKIQNFELKSDAGQIYALKDIGDVKIQDGPVSISERDGKRYASITADINSNDTAKVVSKITKDIDGIKSGFKPGTTYSIGGSMDDINETFGQMGMAMMIAIFLVFITMVLTFKEATAPFSILFSLPFAAVGALLALVITNHPISMSGMVGLLMLIGIVVTNAIVLVDRVQKNRNKGMSIKEALFEAGAVRLRPIIMTAAATIMALIPLAAGFAEGAIISEELGIVVIGGLTMSTVLTLIIVPVIYSLLEGLKMKVMNRVSRTKAVKAEA